MRDLIKKRGFWISAFLLAVAVIFVYKTFDSFQVILVGIGMVFRLLTPFIIGFIIAFLLYIPTSRLEKLFKKAGAGFVRRHTTPISIACVYIVLICAISILLSFALPALISSVIDLLNKLPAYYQNALDMIQPYFDEGGLLASVDFDALKSSFSVESVLKLIDMNSVRGAISSAVNIGGGVVRFFIGVIVSIYLLADRRHLVRVTRALLASVIPQKRLERIGYYVGRVISIFYRYVYSQFLDALVVAVMCIIALTALRVPYALVLGTMVGALNLVPYFGATIGGVIAVVITLFSGGLIPAVLCGVTILVLQQIDGNFIQPRIVGSQVGIRPIYVILAVMVGGGLFGVAGILLGVPVVAVLKMLLTDYLQYKSRKKSAVRFAEAEEVEDVEEAAE